MASIDEKKNINKKSKFLKSYTHYKSNSSVQNTYKSNSSSNKDEPLIYITEKKSQDSNLPFYILFNKPSKKNKFNQNLELTTFEKILYFILIILGTIQFGIFLKYFDFVNDKNLFFKKLPYFIQVITILLWKFQMILLFFMIYYFYFGFIYQTEFSQIVEYENNDSLNISLFSYYLESSNLYRAIQLSIEGNFIYSILGFLQSFILMISCFYNTFGLCYLFNSLSNIIPFFLGDLISKSFKDKKKIYLFFSIILILLGLIFLFTTINNIYSIVILIILFFVSFLSQKLNQSYYYQKFQDESPFNLIFSNYFNYTIITSIILSLYCLYKKKCYIFLFFGYLLNIKLFSFAFIDFGILGAVYIQLMIFTSFSNRKIRVLKILKYYELILIDLLGVYLFKRYKNPYNITYIFGLLQCSLGMIIIDYIDKVKLIIKKYF
jgi:hypothetical protein